MLSGPERTIAAYLRRIDAVRPPEANLASLAALQIAHLRHVPFENLDIQRGVPIVLDLESILDKVVTRARGGYCYELNSAFGALLVALGYQVDLVSARVARDGGVFSQDFAHMALIVTAADVSERLLVDVGFGDAFTQPLPLTTNCTFPDRDRMVQLRRIEGSWLYEEDRGQGWDAQYTFTLQPRRLHEFAAMNEWQQTSPESHFATGLICSLLTERGRETVAGDRLIVTEAGHRHQRWLEPGEVEKTLRDRFGIAI
jgi:N-hydroxyarylamine O-acetyltransferase